MKKITIITVALALSGCILDHDREVRPGRKFKVDCLDKEGWPPEPKIADADSNFTCYKDM